MTTVVFFCWAERGVVLNEALHKPFEQEGWDTCCKRLRRSMALRWDSGSQKGAHDKVHLLAVGVCPRVILQFNNVAPNTMNTRTITRCFKQRTLLANETTNSRWFARGCSGKKYMIVYTYTCIRTKHS